MIVVPLFVIALVAPSVARAAPGQLDRSFSGDGKATTPKVPLTGEWAEAIVIQDDGQIVLVGSSENGDTGDLGTVAFRYLEDGTPDPAFGAGDGHSALPVPSQGHDAAQLSDGRIVIAGQVTVGGDSQFAVVLLETDGDLDATFGVGGVSVIDFGPGLDLAYGVAVDESDRIVVVGRVGVPDGLVFGVARLDSTGTTDPGFSSDGMRTVRFAGGAQARDVAIQADGKIVVVGGAKGFSRFAVARLLDDGSLDSAFEGDGKTTTYTGGDATSVAIQGDGRIVVVGGDGPDFELARYRANGTLDPKFGRKGRVHTDFGRHEDLAFDVTIGSGKIVVVGGTSWGYDFALARYRRNGRLDRTFSGDGKLRTDFKFDYAYAAAVDGSGRLVVSGYSSEAMATARYLMI